jgi:ribosomal protein S18 acetylase RimI-like enzyme
VALLREVYAPFQAEFRPTALREDEASVGARPDAWLVAEDGDGLAGAVQHGPEGDDHTFCFLAVRPDRRRRGVGSLLVEHVVALAAAAGCPTVLIAVRSSLGENVAFFERRGFRRVGPFGTGHHDVYARELAAP